MKTTRKFFHQPKLGLSLLIIALIFSLSPDGSNLIPITGLTGEKNPYFTSPIASKIAFINQVMNGNTEQITGIWLPNLTGLIVIEQPTGQPGFVSDRTDEVTNFQLAKEYGSIGLLAHAYLAGAVFNELVPDQFLTIIYGDGSSDVYQITDIRQYQALDPDNAYTDFISTNNGGEKISQEDLFFEIYGHPGRLILQTCIILNNDNLWGRKFIMASKVE